MAARVIHLTTQTRCPKDDRCPLRVQSRQFGRRPTISGMGHSLGWLVAIALSLRKDYPIRGLVLASGYYFPTSRWDVWLMSGPAAPVLGDLLSYTVAPIVSWAILPAAFLKIFAPRSAPQRFKNQFPTSLVLRPTQLRAAAEESELLIPMAAQFQASYPNIDCQVRILHGAEDQVIEPKQAQDLYQALPRSSFGSKCWAYGHPFRDSSYCHSSQCGRKWCKFDQSGRSRRSSCVGKGAPRRDNETRYPRHR